jgi:tetratricopeptide (TPR) repeat protein
MQRFLAVFVVLGAVSSTLAGGPTLKEARQRLLRGNYAEARELYTALIKDARQRVPATIGLSRAMESEGEYDQAQTTIDTALKDLPRNADLLGRRAELLYLRGRWNDAEKAAATALAIQEDHFPARWVLGQVYRDRGEVDKADEEFRWFVRTYTQRSNNDMEITDPDELITIGQAGCERARWHNLSDQFRFILNEVFAETVKQDKDFWWGDYHSGRLYLEKYNKADANRAFDRALVINPRAAEVLVSKGIAAFQRLDIKDAELYAQQALKINPSLTEALRLQADIHAFSGNQAEAMKVLEKARGVNPRDEATLARIASSWHAQGKHTAFADVVKEVQKHNPRAGVFYYELAERLEERKRYDLAEKYFEQSIKLRPNLPWAQNGLGLLYMQLGKEDEAKKILEKAFEADPFNVRVSNTLKVLDHLEKYATLKTEHFLLKYDPKNDRVLAAFMARYLEDTYQELAELFQYRPKGPILIELFNKHEMFSGRVVALPDLHTIGACTGQVVAMVSPRDKQRVITKPFNWVRVIRHELVHVFNLEQTKFQVPHWFTEGLAVTYEGTPPPPRWHYLLAERVQSGELLNLDNILLGFVRPSSPEEWHLAYLQSQLYVEYLTKTHGKAAMGKLLDAFRDGLDTGSAIEKVCQVDKASFEKGYRAFLQERVKNTVPAAVEKKLTTKQLKEALAKDPENADLKGQLAERYLVQGDKQQARKLADEALAAKEKQPAAAYVKAKLLNDAGETDRAVAILTAASDAKTADVKVLKLLGKILADGKKSGEAAKILELGRQREPYEPGWLVQLAKLYVQDKENDKLIGVLKDLVLMDADDLATRRKLAQLQLKAGNHADAEKYARQVLEIDVLDSEGQLVLEAALSAQKKEDDLRLLRKLLQE